MHIWYLLVARYYSVVFLVILKARDQLEVEKRLRHHRVVTVSLHKNLYFITEVRIRNWVGESVTGEGVGVTKR